jgi:hypothetical protein
MIRAVDVEKALSAAREAGLESELTFPHWLGKIHYGKEFIDLVFRAGNGLCEVTDTWFEHAFSCDVLGRNARICPAEEIIWTKAFILERERYDGGDIAHLLKARADQLDWSRLVALFGENWRLLLNQLVLFGFIYPGERGRIPVEVMNALIGRLQDEVATAPPTERVCRGTLISRQQYLQDTSEWGYRDARLQPEGAMSAEQVAQWTEAIWAQAQHSPRKTASRCED